VTDPAPQPAVPAPADRAALNAALLATGAETGFWDGQGRPALWPADIDEWGPAASGSTTHDPGQPF